MEIFSDKSFPIQRVSGSEKRKASWYANCIDYIIAAGLSYNDRKDTETKLAILHGDIPNSFYKKTLNPYNSNNEKYTRFPATMRNLDIMTDIVRRYVSEYFKGIHEFVVGASNPDIVLKKNAKLREEIGIMAAQAFRQEFERRLQELQAQAQQQGVPPEQVNVQDAMPNPEEFINNFNEKYIDDESAQAQELLNYIRSITSDIMIYLSSFFEYVALGECYTYSDIRGEKIIKENVPCLEAYPIPNNQFFVEDHDMFARRMLLSYSQIIDMFDEYLTDKDRKFLEDYYSKDTTHGSVKLMYSKYFETYPDVCEKFTDEERTLFKHDPINIYSENNNLWEVWHVVWRGEAKRGILTYINEAGFETQRVVDEDYKLDSSKGELTIEWAYEPQVYEGYRIGGRSNAIYPIKARPIAFERDGKLPYNGIMEILPFMGKFSIIKTITPYQIMRNIFAYHREMVIAKNKMLILLLPESLVADKSEDRVYRMAADGTLLVDDSEDSNSQKMAQIRLLNANMGDYISQITQLMEATRQEAWDTVDMNAQRYGDIAQSAGAATTQEAVARSSMGSVIIVEIFDQMRRRDYQRDLDFAKLAYIDGLDTAYFDSDGNRHYLSLDVNSFIYSACGVIVKNDSKEKDKINQLRQWAFSAAQNGDLDMAMAAITGDNITQIKTTIQKFIEIKQQHEKQMKQVDAQLKEEELQVKLAQIEAKGQQDKELEELKFQHEMALKYVDVDMSMLGTTGDESEQAKNRLAAAAEDNRARIEQEKINLQRQQIQADLYSKAADRAVKMEDIRSKERIAKTNKNKYDK
ncbi:MAG: hypothetical protein IJG68_02050 [Bacilli bacterium]|nr:hypothetical protein [Bacilli bacterium]